MVISLMNTTTIVIYFIPFVAMVILMFRAIDTNRHRQRNKDSDREKANKGRQTDKQR